MPSTSRSVGPEALRTLVDRWLTARPAERANAQSYIIELCHAIGVEPPRPAGSGYEFEFPVRVIGRDGTESVNFIDLYHAHHFALEAKDQDPERPNDMLLRKAFGQLRSYLGHLPDERPPYLLVIDVGRTLIVWDRWSGDYGGFSAGRRIDLTTLADSPGEVELLRDIWTNPSVRNPRSRAIAVTKDIAERLAELAAQLERDGYEQERVARFLMRCVFTMFAEDIGLLPGEPFRHIIDDVALATPQDFVTLATDLWRAMDEGRRFLLRKLLRFNGHFFKVAEALPLSRDALAMLLNASRADWQHVEPSVFGTLLTRALDRDERHRLGAEYTPREFVERVVRPAVEEPLRERWTLVQADVLQLRQTGKKKDRQQAERRLREFHAWLLRLNFLDPACGSGNFLYVTMHLVKRIELEVIRAIEELTGKHEMRLAEVGPWQFHGIEVNPWAREIAELTLWIGFHQFWKEHHDVQPPEPILQDTGTLECRDGVLAWDAVTEVPEQARPDPTPRIRHPVTGALVPDPNAKLPYLRHEHARQSAWPEADFIIGNPPYLGQARQREAFGDGYVDALRAAYPEVPDTADYVMYWWYRAAKAVASGRAIRAGLITTNSIVQSQNRGVIADAESHGVRVMWAVPDHPWVNGADGAAVRVAMTVLAHEPTSATRIVVDDDARLLSEVRVDRLNADLTAHADVATAAGVPLHANEGLCSPGFKLHGTGFLVPPDEATRLLRARPSLAHVLRPYLGGRDLARRSRGLHVIDFGLMSENQAREYPVLYDIVRDRVKPERDANNDPSTREKWWRFGRNREEFRPALVGLSRYIATVETSKHRVFQFLDAAVAPDNMLICFASDDPFHLGVLSSAIHRAWALAAGGHLGVGNDPRYNKTRCFDPYPFPVANAASQRAIGDIASRIDQHRKAAVARDDRVTITGIYNVLEKLRTGEALTRTERHIHRTAACNSLRDLHDELDAAVASAYNWYWPLSTEEILESLVALHSERTAEEASGRVRWLRPRYQVPRFGAAVVGQATAMEFPFGETKVPRGRPRIWPTAAIEQMAALKRLIAKTPLTVDEALVRFDGAKRELVQRHLETLAVMGEMWTDGTGRYHAAEAASVAA